MQNGAGEGHKNVSRIEPKVCKVVKSMTMLPERTGVAVRT